MRLATTVAVAAIVAGCLAPAAPRDDPSGAEPTLPSSLDVDLHDHVLHITMPEGQPTMLVALNVSKDMWVRPPVRQDAAFQDDGWMICPWIRSSGMSPGLRYATLAFWLDEGTLKKATAADTYLFDSKVSDDSPTSCERPSDGRPAHTHFVMRPEPWDGTLVLLLAVGKDVMATPPAAVQAMSFRVGIAYHECEAQPPSQFDPLPRRLCPPERIARAEPQVRGGETRQAFYDSRAGPCRECGFEIRDARSGGTGTVTAKRSSAPPSGIIYVGGKSTGETPYPPGYVGALGGVRSETTTSLAMDGDTTRGTCRSAVDAQVSVIARKAGQADLTVTMQTIGDYAYLAWMWEFPLNLDLLGWRMSPLTYFWVWPYSWTTGDGAACS